MSEKFQIHLQGTSDTKQWISAQGVLSKIESSAAKFIETLRQGVGIDLGGKLVRGIQALPDIFVSVLKSGVAFNVELHDSEIAIANVIQKFSGLNAEASKQEAAKAIAKIVELEPKVAGTLGDLTRGLLSTVASAQGAGVSLEQNIELVGLFANALANANIPAEQLTQELRAIFTGNITPDAALGKMLEITNADIEKAKQMGNLYETLKNKIGTMGQAGDTAAVAFSTLQSAIAKAQGILAKPLFEQVTKGAKEFAEALDDPKIVENLREIGVGIGDIVKAGAGFTRWLVENSRDLLKWSDILWRVVNALTSIHGLMKQSKYVAELIVPPPAPPTKAAPAAAPAAPVEFAPAPFRDPFATAPESGGGGRGSGSGSPDKAKLFDTSGFDTLFDADIEKIEREERIEWARKVEDAEIAIAQARAAGHVELAKQFSDQKEIMELARRYRTELNLGIDEALAKAKQRVGLERSIADALSNAKRDDDVKATPMDLLISRAQNSRRGITSGLGSPLKGPSFKGATFESGSLGSPLRASFDLASTAPQIIPPSSSPLQGAGSGAAGAGQVGDNKSAAAARQAAAEVTRLTAIINSRDGATAGELNRLKAALVTLQRSVEDAHRKIADNRS